MTDQQRKRCHDSERKR